MGGGFMDMPQRPLRALGQITLVLGFVAIYAPSTLGTWKHREASHPRIMHGPTLIATLFTLEAPCLGRPGADR
jgi:hypothetical protein